MDIFNDFCWHSISEPCGRIASRRKVRSLPVKASVLVGFRKVEGSSFLIHKSTKALWKFSDDNATIEPCFEDDVITEEDIEGILEG